MQVVPNPVVQAAPAPQAPAQPVGAPIQRPEAAIVAKKSAPEMQALQQQAAQSAQLGQVGTRSQIDSLKARVQSVDLQGTVPPPELGNLETVQKYGGMALSTVGSGIAAIGRAGKNYFAGGFIEAHDNRALGSSVSASAQTHLDRATGIRANADSLGASRDRLTALLDAPDPDWGQVDNVLKEVAQHFESGGLATDMITAARQALWNDPSKSREVVAAINVAQPIMRASADSLQAKAQALQAVGTGLSAEGNRGIVRNTVDVVQKANPIVSGVNFVAQAVAASENAQNFAEALSSGAGKLIQGSALTGIMIGGGALQIVSEGIELAQNRELRNKALDRVEMAQALLADGPGRTKMADEFDAKAKELENPETRMGKMKKFFFGTNAADVATLKAKAAEIRKLGAAPVSDEARTVAQQIINRADTGFKAVKMLKNVLGIAAGAVAIVAAVATMATPVGWALAGVALAAAVGCAIYTKVKTSQRQGKIDDLNGVIQQSQIKQQTKGQQIEQLNAQIQELQLGLQPQIREKSMIPEPRTPEQDLRYRALDSAITKSQDTLVQLRDQLQTLQQEVVALQGMATEATGQLLGASPDEAAKHIIEGVRRGDAQMRYLAQAVLGVPNVDMLKEADAIQLLKRGMSLDPSK